VCGEYGHNAHSCPKLALKLYALVKCSHAVKDIRSFVEDADNAGGVKVTGLPGVHGNGKKRKRYKGHCSRAPAKRSCQRGTGLGGGKARERCRKQRSAARLKRKRKQVQTLKDQRNYKRRVRKQEAFVIDDKDELGTLDCANLRREKTAFSRLCTLGWAYRPSSCPACKQKGLRMEFCKDKFSPLRFKCDRNSCKRRWSPLRFTFLRQVTMRGVGLQQVVAILEAYYGVHSETPGKPPSVQMVSKILGYKWIGGGKLVRKVVHDIGHAEASYGKHLQSERKLSGIVEVDATCISSFCWKDSRYHYQLFVAVQRQRQDGHGLQACIYQMALGKTKQASAPPVEDRVKACGGFECIDTKQTDCMVSDGARLYPTVANSLRVPHYHVAHGKGVWVREVRRGRKPNLSVHSGTIDNFWTQLKNAMPSLRVTTNPKTQDVNPEEMRYAH
ncbi:unnamed protein product, partial [Prorocentrum cordatum]